MNGVTTIKLHVETKQALEHVKQDSESYEDAIKRLVSIAVNKNLKAELIEAYTAIGKKDLQHLAEWDAASSEVEEYG